MKKRPLDRAGVPLAVITLVAAWSQTAWSMPVTETYRSGPLDLPIADHEPVLTSVRLTSSGSAIRSLTGVRVTLDLRGDPGVDGGGFASDVFVSLLVSDVGGVPGPGAPGSVLLNRVEGGYNGWQVTFDDAAVAGDIHGVAAESGTVLGSYQPDGRWVEGGDVRTGLLAVFAGLDGSADWWLNVGDLSPNGTMTLWSWEIELTGDTVSSEAGLVPEGGTGVAGLGLGLAVAWAWALGRGRGRRGVGPGRR